MLAQDLKPGNLLITKNGAMKLGMTDRSISVSTHPLCSTCDGCDALCCLVCAADFGLAKFYGSPDRNLSNQACTL